jgi:8-oxo-dGTP pyrophosphatase MutT (NUDIX family)
LLARSTNLQSYTTGSFLAIRMAFVPLSKIPHFDPRAVPVTGFDKHLTAVPAAKLTVKALRARFVHPPEWTPEVREEPSFSDRQPTPAAVLIAIALADGVTRHEATVLLTQRTAHLSTHSGQVAFAGGKVDAGDADAVAAALREAQEEVALDSRYCEVLGTLPRYITGTAFHITPVVALVQPGFSIKANPFEVADVFEVPLSFLMNPANHARHELLWSGVRREWFSMHWRGNADMPDDRFVWGATAGMLRNLYRFLIA